METQSIFTYSKTNNMYDVPAIIHNKIIITKHNENSIYGFYNSSHIIISHQHKT